MKTLVAMDTKLLFMLRDFLMALPFGERFWTSISWLGDGGRIWILFGIFLLLYPKTRKWGIVMFASLGVNAVLCNLILKPMIFRMRPYDALDYTPLIAPLSDGSLPSGHTSASFACAVVLWHMNRKAGVAAFVFSTLMALSRIYVGVHYPFDVLAGVLLGAFSAYVVLTLKKRKRTNKIK